MFMNWTTARFQSTLPHGSDLLLWVPVYPHCNFNPRSLTGATFIQQRIIDSLVLFQSTLPHGSDTSILFGISPLQIISIHAPSRERPLPGLRFLRASAFQSTLPHGSDASHNITNFLLHAFQSTLPHGSDRRGESDMHGERISIHAPSRERHHRVSIHLRTIGFQSTLPHGSDLQELQRYSAC